MVDDPYMGMIRIGTEDRAVWVPQSDYFAFCDRLTHGEVPPQRLNSLRGLFNQYIDRSVYDAGQETAAWFKAGFDLIAGVYPVGSLDIE